MPRRRVSQASTTEREGRKGGGVNVGVRSVGGPHAVRSAWVRRCVEKMIGALEIGDVEVSVVLVSDDRMRALNLEYRGLDRTTDVLSFAMREGPFGDGDDPVLGDIVVSVPMAIRQAERRGHEVLVEMKTLLAHGLLHLLGYDHQTASDRLQMQRATRALMKQVQL